MSAPKRRLVIMPDARADINGIQIYTQQRWGVEQRRRYRAKLRAAMRSLVDFPELGRARNEYFIGCRSLPVEQHVIVYRLSDDEVVVVRVLHGSQDATDQVHP